MVIKQLKLPLSSQIKLIKKFPPQFASIYCDHVTLEFNASNKEMKDNYDVKVIGWQECKNLGDCIVIEVDGKQTRSDGRLFHITMSTNNVPPVISNDILDNMHFVSVEPMVLEVIPHIQEY